MRALVTGSEGFVGKHLIRELEAEKYNVLPTGRHEKDTVLMDVLDYEQVRAVFHYYKPDLIFHLAAIAFVPASWQDPELVLRTNIIGTLNILNAVRAGGLKSTVLIAGSSEEYGDVPPAELPIKETNPLRPLSPYAVSKIAADFLGYQYFRSYGMRIIRTRAFNHEGHGRDSSYMPSGFARQIVEIEKGLKKPVIYHGDLSTKRDISDVRDIVRAYRLAVEKGSPGEVYNIGSGKAVSGEEVLEILLDLSGIKVKKQIDPVRMRPSDCPILLADSQKFKRETGWEPKYTLRETLAQELCYWRQVIK